MPTWFTQENIIFDNLISNAVKHKPSPAKTITAAALFKCQAYMLYFSYFSYYIFFWGFETTL